MDIEGAVSGSDGRSNNNRPGRLRILLVEDDPQALATTIEALEALGHFTAGTSSAEVARARFLDGAFDVLITDLNLPGLSGSELADEISRHATQPLQVIFATGKPRPPGSTALWLQKPYLLEDLARALDEAASRLCAPGKDAACGLA